jgi:hypothetical protein
LLALTRENALVLTLPVVLWLLWNDRASVASDSPARENRPGRRPAFLGGCALVLLPVGARNYVVGGQFQLTTSQFGPNFDGNHPGARGPTRPRLLTR